MKIKFNLNMNDLIPLYKEAVDTTNFKDLIELGEMLCPDVCFTNYLQNKVRAERKEKSTNLLSPNVRPLFEIGIATVLYAGEGGDVLPMAFVGALCAGESEDLWKSPTRHVWYNDSFSTVPNRLTFLKLSDQIYHEYLKFLWGTEPKRKDTRIFSDTKTLFDKVYLGMKTDKPLLTRTGQEFEKLFFADVPETHGGSVE